MLKKLKIQLRENRSLHHINSSLSRAAASASLRVIDPKNPLSWEFCGFSQHGEDGIIDYLTREIRDPNRYFIEIGSADGLENNVTWLAIARNFSGLMIDGDQVNIKWCERLLKSRNYGLRFKELFVTCENVEAVLRTAEFKNPDVFSLDIDGNDYWIMDGLLEAGLRPCILVVEYNSAYGPHERLAIPYNPEFVASKVENGSDLYYGCSISAWKSLFSARGYEFLTVESCGVNAIFIDPEKFPSSFCAGMKSVEFSENCSHVRAYGGGWKNQFKMLAGRELQSV